MAFRTRTIERLNALVAMVGKGKPVPMFLDWTVDTKMTAGGKASPVWASVEVMLSDLSYDGILATLRSPLNAGKNFTPKYPRILLSDSGIAVRLKMVYKGAELADALEAQETGRNVRQAAAAAAAADNIVIPAPAPDAPHEGSATERAATETAPPAVATVAPAVDNVSAAPPAAAGNGRRNRNN